MINIVISRLLNKLIDIYSESYRDHKFPISFILGKYLTYITLLLSSRQSRVTIVEIGTGYGFSTSWFALALKYTRESLGKVITLDKDYSAVKLALRNLRDMSLDSHVDIVVSSGTLPPLKYHLEFIDVLFIDSDKEEYVTILRIFDRIMKKFSVIIAHNVILPAPYMLSEFTREILENDKYMSLILPIDPAGVSITLVVK